MRDKIKIDSNLCFSDLTDLLNPLNSLYLPFISGKLHCLIYFNSDSIKDSPLLHKALSPPAQRLVILSRWADSNKARDHGVQFPRTKLWTKSLGDMSLGDDVSEREDKLCEYLLANDSCVKLELLHSHSLVNSFLWICSL